MMNKTVQQTFIAALAALQGDVQPQSAQQRKASQTKYQRKATKKGAIHQHNKPARPVKAQSTNHERVAAGRLNISVAEYQRRQAAAAGVSPQEYLARFRG